MAYRDQVRGLIGDAAVLGWHVTNQLKVETQ
jgi:hypothetical protein